MDPMGAPRPPEQDPESRLWRLTRHPDVLQALRHPAVVPVGSRDGEGVPGGIAPSFEGLLSPHRWAALRPSLERAARERVDRLPRGEAVELVDALARPWCLEAARALLALDPATAKEALPHAGVVFRAAARSRDGTPGVEGRAAAAELATLLSRTPGPGDPAARVQAFVALTGTLPLLLAGSWLLLLEQGGATPHHPRWLEEVLRLAGPARWVFRETVAPVEVGGIALPAGARLALGLAAANLDPERFPDPGRLDPGRSACPHLSLGAGSHVCAGAALVRDALRLTTTALFRGPGRLVPAHRAPAPRSGGGAIHGPDSLRVVLLPR